MEDFLHGDLAVGIRTVCGIHEGEMGESCMNMGVGGEPINGASGNYNAGHIRHRGQLDPMVVGWGALGRWLCCFKCN
jgi:hypothetical protein